MLTDRDRVGNQATKLSFRRLGVVNESVLGPPESGNGLNTIDATVGVPHNLGEALDVLEADIELVEAVGAQMVAQHVAVKRTEWERFNAATTDWEMREYLPIL